LSSHISIFIFLNTSADIFPFKQPAKIARLAGCQNWSFFVGISRKSPGILIKDIKKMAKMFKIADKPAITTLVP
jgi:hypothetical protein